VVQLHRDIDKIHAAGAEMIVIGNGAPHFIAGFREITGYNGPLYTDPSLAVFQAAELERGVLNTFSLKAIAPSVKAARAGFKQGKTQGDPWQQGGVLIVMPGGAVRWKHVSRRPGDNARAADIVAALG
jgi:hypothetical protein